MNKIIWFLLISFFISAIQIYGLFDCKAQAPMPPPDSPIYKEAKALFDKPPEKRKNSPIEINEGMPAPDNPEVFSPLLPMPAPDIVKMPAPDNPESYSSPEEMPAPDNPEPSPPNPPGSPSLILME